MFLLEILHIDILFKVKYKPKCIFMKIILKLGMMILLMMHQRNLRYLVCYIMQEARCMNCESSDSQTSLSQHYQGIRRLQIAKRFLFVGCADRCTADFICAAYHYDKETNDCFLVPKVK